MIYTIDIGGSSIKHGPFPYKFDVLASLQDISTNKLDSRDFSEIRNKVLEIVESAINKHSSEFISICTTGAVKDGIVLNAGHFNDYRNVSWSEIIKGKFPNIKKVVTINDGKAAAFAEYKSLNSEATSFIHLVIGTGLGGSAILNGDFIEGSDGFAGNFGHLKVTEKQTIACSCGKTGCVETICSVPGIISSFAQRHVNWRETDFNVPSFSDVVELARNNDSSAIQIFAEAGEYAGIAISYCLNLLNPSAITLGGGVIDATREIEKSIGHNPLIDGINSAIRKYAHKRVVKDDIIKFARHGNNSGLIGAALFLEEIQSPTSPMKA